MKILFVNAYYNGGGAELVVRQLYHGVKMDGIESYCIIGRWQKNIPEEIEVIYSHFLERVSTTIIGGVLNNTLLKTRKARKKIIELIEKESIDIVHFHNMHSNYIGMKDIEEISQHCSKIVITLHDMWLLTGGCAHACECEKWKTEECKGCSGNYSMKPFKLAHKLFEKKREIFADSKIYFVTPSKWLYDKVKQSYLKNTDIRIINNGIELNEFQEHSKVEMRKKYDLPLDKNILLFVANGMNNIYKGFTYLLKALNMLNEKEKYVLLIVGNKDGEIIELPYETYMMGYVSSHTVMNELYSAADLYIHPSMADVYPFTVMESLASGTPVVAFRTGGIPEIVREDVGWLVEPGNYNKLKECIEYIFQNKVSLENKTIKCREYIEQNNGIDKTILNYRKLYFDIMN